MRACNVCETDKPDGAFRKFGRGLKKTCRECEGGGSTMKVALVTSEPPPVKIDGHLEIAAGLGVRASIEDGTLQLEQDRLADDGVSYTHSIALAPHEARQIVDWIAQQVKIA